MLMLAFSLKHHFAQLCFFLFKDKAGNILCFSGKKKLKELFSAVV